jgi:hypothetical protein
MLARADGGGGELRTDTTAPVTGSSGGGVVATPPDLEVARRRTRPRIDDGRRGFGRTPGRTGGRGPAPQRTGLAPRLRPPPARCR